MGNEYRTERDTLGEVRVPAEALWGAQTQRAVENFPVSGWRMPRGFIRALALIKQEAAAANLALGALEAGIAEAIGAAAAEVAAGDHDAHFPVDVFQTGSGTSSNMNANEVIARLAAIRLGRPVHPNDHVNMSQSSNDVVPSALYAGAALRIAEGLVPALVDLEARIGARARELDDVVKTGRTHLMDAMPLTLGQELGGWAAQIRDARRRLEEALPRLCALPIGGTAVGTGVNADPAFAARVCAGLSGHGDLDFTPAADRFAIMSCPEAALEASGQLRALAAGLAKIANDLRWMNSGPLAGLGEIRLPALQPGSSIMPGKVNPVIPEAVAMACAQVVGHDAAIALAVQSGSFQLNVMLPLIAYDLLQGIEILGASARLLGERAIDGFEVDRERLAGALDRNPILVTALNPVIGYERGAAIAKAAYAQRRPVIDVAREMTDLDEETLRRLLDPRALTGGG